MNTSSLQQIGRHVMPVVPLATCDIGFLFGTRHGVEEFCDEAFGLWRRGMFAKLLISGGATSGQAETEADIIGARLRQLGMPASAMILEHAATNTGENVILGLAKLRESISPSSIGSVLAIGKICSTRRYAMTLEKHWPGLRLSCWGVNYFGVSTDNWFTHDEFRRRVIDEFIKIPHYLERGFLCDLPGFPPYPALADCQALLNAAEREMLQHHPDDHVSVFFGVRKGVGSE
jgi:hypothetical protein